MNKKNIFLLFICLFLSTCYQHGEYVPSINDSTLDGDKGFLFFGDWGTGDSNQKKVAESMQNYCKKKFCQYVVNLGDNFYPAGVKNVDDTKWKTHFLDMYEKLNLVFYSALGNHDHDGNIQAQIDYTQKSPLWYMPSRYYQFSKADIDFFALDTDPRGYDAKQLQWLEEKLSKATGTWKVVFGHHPVFSYGAHKGETQTMVDTLLPLLKKYNVDFYLAGHEHDKQVLVSDSIHFIVSGAAGQTRPTKKGPLSLFASPHLGFMHLKFRDKIAHVSVLDEQGFSEFERTIKKK